ncbi:MAG: DegT/DnrJ/EryC1/StrS family aminotransferase [Acidimicrobiia bacterium]
MSKGRISLADPDVGKAEARAVYKVVSSGWISAGRITAGMEEDLALKIGAPGVVLVSSGTAALHLALLVAGVGPGDEVLVPSMSFVASASTVVMVGATPRFVDVAGLAEPNLDPTAVAEAITERTRAVLVTHLAGFPARVDALRNITDEAGVELIEDCAHAPLVSYGGRQLGTFGRLGVLSFHTTKSISMGEGGAIVCRDTSDADHARLLRNHGLQRDDATFAYDVATLGFNYRPSEVAAAVGRVQLDRLADDRDHRRELRTLYESRLGVLPGVNLPFAGWQGDSAHHLLPVVLPPYVDRDAVRRHLLAVGIESGVHYPPIHELTQYRQAPQEPLAATVAYGRQHLTLPLHRRVTRSDVATVADALGVALKLESGGREAPVRGPAV